MSSQPDTESYKAEHAEVEVVDDDLQRIDTVNVDNYHGLSAKTILVYCVRCFLGITHLLL